MEGGSRTVSFNHSGPKYKDIPYIGIGSNFFLSDKKYSYINISLLYDNKVWHSSDDKLYSKIGIGYRNELSEPIFIDISGGLLLSKNNGLFYLGITLGPKF